MKQWISSSKKSKLNITNVSQIDYSHFIFFPHSEDASDKSVKLLTPIPKPQPKSTLKRKMEDSDMDDMDELSSKKAKVSHTVVDNVILLDEDDDEVVLLD